MGTKHDKKMTGSQGGKKIKDTKRGKYIQDAKKKNRWATAITSERFLKTHSNLMDFIITWGLKKETLKVIEFVKLKKNWSWTNVYIG